MNDMQPKPATQEPRMPKPTKSTIALIDEVLFLDDQIAALEDKRAKVAESIVKRVGIGGTIENDLARITACQNTVVTVDFDALVQAKPTWAKRVTKHVLDQAKFTLLRKAGMVPVEVEELVKEKLCEPYLRITRR